MWKYLLKSNEEGKRNQVRRMRVFLMNADKGHSTDKDQIKAKNIVQ